MISAVNWSIMVSIKSTFCFGAYAQTNPQVKVVVIPMGGGDEPAKDDGIFISKNASAAILIGAQL